MARIGIVSYNRYGNFTNYGSALQSWAMCRAVDKLGAQSVLVDYLPEVLRDKNPLNPMAHMWDTDPVARRQCEMSLPSIRENYQKFQRFFAGQFRNTHCRYTAQNFASCPTDEGLQGFLCGSDTIFCTDEFGFDDGYYARYPVMQGRSAAYAASFGDAVFGPDTLPVLAQKLQGFLAIGLRESPMVNWVRDHTSVPVQRVIDPTLLLTAEDYAPIIAPRQQAGEYLLLYARRYNPAMERFAMETARRLGVQVVEISLRAENAAHHPMFYQAGVEEFLSLVRHAACVVTNSYHGMIFSVQLKRPFYLFSREQCDGKIGELLSLMGLTGRLLVTGREAVAPTVDYDAVDAALAPARRDSLAFLQNELDLLTR